ncbi:hypothetical protein [Salipiger aestuarii]|uniref:hypothetical protein n=1 Tax=Salipiger aestuarii TaxID=568098 RepID=UPI001479476A|nr:hypothetical protein [Salipiger aestuarii]
MTGIFLSVALAAGGGHEVCLRLWWQQKGHPVGRDARRMRGSEVQGSGVVTRQDT